MAPPNVKMPIYVKNVARCEVISTLNVKIDAQCEKL